MFCAGFGAICFDMCRNLRCRSLCSSPSLCSCVNRENISPFADAVVWMLSVVLKYHVIDGRRCEVKKALTKSEMNSVKAVAGANSAVPMGGQNQDYAVANNMPYGMPAGNMGGWQQGAWNVDENTAVGGGSYGYTGAPCNPNANAPFGMNFGNVAGMLGSMLASMGAQGAFNMNMGGAGYPGAGPGGYPGTGPGAAGYPGQNAGNMSGWTCSLFFTLFTLFCY